MLISFLLSRQKNLNEMAKKVAELFVEVLTAAGVERIYGVAAILSTASRIQCGCTRGYSG
jgi:NTP pyrophosphatase (non-canonical NTP hydrolase)